MRSQDSGLGVLVRSSRARRPATARDVLAMGEGFARAAGPMERFIERADWARVPITESGHEVLVRRALGGPMVGQEDVGQLVSTPGQIGSQMDYVHAQYVTLNADIMAATNVSEAFKNAWRRDYYAWATFYRDHRDSTWSRMWGGTLTQSQEYLQALDRWRTAFVALGGVASAPAPVQRESALGEGGLNRMGDSISVIAGAVAVVAVAGVIALVVIELK